MVLRLKSMGKPTTLSKNYKFWTELRYCMVFGLKPGIAWSSDSNLWGNQLLKENSKFWTESRYCMVLRLKPMGKPTT